MQSLPVREPQVVPVYVQEIRMAVEDLAVFIALMVMLLVSAGFIAAMISLRRKRAELPPPAQKEKYMSKVSAARNSSWIIWVIGGIVAVVVIFTVLYVNVFAPAGNSIDKADQSNQLKHDQRQSAIINQENRNVYGSIGYQDAQIQIMQQRLANIEGPAGLALDRAGLPGNSGEQQVLQASEDSEISYLCEAGAKVAPDNPQFTSGHPSLAQIYAANCTAGTIKASPPLDRNPVPDGGA